MSAASDDRSHIPSLRDYLQIVWRHKVTIVVLCALLPIAALAYSLSQQALYQSTAEVLLSQVNAVTGAAGGSTPLPLEDPDRFAVTQARLARNAGVLQSTVRAVGVAESPAQLRSESSVSASPDSDFLNFRVTNPSGRLAARLATEYARQFTLYRSRLDTATFIRARADIATKLSRLKRAHQSNSRFYSNLVTEQQRLTTLELLQSPRAILANKPTGAAKIRPRWVRNTFVGAGFGVLLALALAFILDALDTRIYSAAELADGLGLRLLGRTPPPQGRIARHKRLVMLADPAPPQAEAYRELRLTFELSNLEPRARLVMVTSAVSGEGKSVTAANLAAACARAGRDVLLVDADLRKPRLHEFFGISARPGLTDVMLGRTELDQALVRVPLRLPRSLTILPAGLVPRDPASVFETNTLAALMTKLGSLYELVFIDTPPLLQAADGIVLSSRIDALVVVARAGKSRRPEVRKLRHVLESISARKLGLVVTGARPSADYAEDSVYAGPSAGEHSEPEATPVPIERSGTSMFHGPGDRSRLLGSDPGTRANEAPGPSLVSPSCSDVHTPVRAQPDEGRCLAPA